MRQSVHLIGRALEDAGERLPGGLCGSEGENEALLTLCTRQESLLLREYRAALANAILVPPPFSGPVSLRADTDSGPGESQRAGVRELAQSPSLMEHDYAAAASGSGAPAAETEGETGGHDIEMREIADLKPKPPKFALCPHDYNNAGDFIPHEEFKFLDLFKTGYEKPYVRVICIICTYFYIILQY